MNIAWVKRHYKDIACMAIIFAVALIPRVTNLGTFLTTDEKTWITRSYEFARAFQDFRFNDMIQTTHPGVTTLWAVGTTVLAKVATSDIPFEIKNLFHFVKSTQFVIAFLNAASIPFIYLLLYIALRARGVAFFAATLLALDPFIIGYSRVVHVDALLGSFLTLSVLSTIVYARTRTRGWLIASAALAALALLTKFPAVFIFPFIICAIIVFYGKEILQRDVLMQKSKDAIVWLLIIILMILIIWPALLWVPNPVGNVLQVKRDVSVAASTPHDMNEDYTLNAMHYPAALLARSNPVALFGAVVGIIAVAIGIYKKKPSKEMGLIVVYLVAFVIMMTLGAKKGDRYIIPAFFALHIVAAYGIIWVVTNFSPSRLRDKAVWGVCGVASLYLMWVVASYHPYEIAYSNPMFPDNISQELGWGEGLDIVAKWLNENHPNAIVASWYPGELGAFTTARVVHINAHEQNQVQFIVVYRNMFGREPAHYANDFIDEYYKKREPVFVARVAGKEFAWVYEKPSYPKTIGDLDASMIVVQEAAVKHENLAGIRIFPATRFGEANTGKLSVDVSRALGDAPFFSTQIPMTEVKDAAWQPIDFPQGVSIPKGERVFISIRSVGSSAPYASMRYSSVPFRDTPIYISRTGNIKDAVEKPGSISVQLTYIGTDGKLRTELETKLLR